MSNPSDSSTRTDEESVNRPVLKSKYQKPSSLVHTLKTMRMDEVPEVYPPVGYLVAETEEIRAAWEEHLKSAPFSDPRSANETRRQIVMMDFEKINYTVPEGESVEIQDFKTDKILIAVKQKVFGRKTVQNANGGVLDHLNQSKGTRVSICLFGL